MAITRLKKLHVRKFRALQNVDIEFGTHVTVICGKNGTSKSSILGIAAQIFSFEKDYVTQATLDYKTISGDAFKSLPSEHFRFSDKYDVPGSLDVAVELQDGYTGTNSTAELELMKRTLKDGRQKARPVVRKNSTVAKGNASRNFTHPVVYLSLKRLQPITYRDYKVSDFKYLTENKQHFLALSNKLLNKTSSAATATSGTISSIVAHSQNYDQDSVSAGEDNVGQIVMALMSFRKLKEEYADYKGGLLLIDEADAGLFPAAQLALLEVLERECSDLNLQVVMTSHSPTLIERVYDLSKEFQRKFKTIYLSDTYGPVRSMPDMSWAQIYADLHIETVRAGDDVSLPKINVYFEDREGFDFFLELTNRAKFKAFINTLESITMGCSNYLHLIDKGVPEFAKKSVIVLDADVVGKVNDKVCSVALLPGKLPPDQLIFEFLYNLPADDEIWANKIGFTRAVFIKCAQEVIGSFAVAGDVVELAPKVEAYAGKKKARDIFKDFYKHDDFQRFVSLRNGHNPWRRWVKENRAEAQDFKAKFIACLTSAMSVGYGVDPGKLALLSA